MKYLLYYNLDSEFVNDQTACGGDGTNVVSVVDGVAFINTEGHNSSGFSGDEKVYYRYAKPNDTGSVTSYTVTVHYTDSIGKTLAQDDVYTVDTYIGKSTKFFIAPKSIENYVPIKSGASVAVSSNTEYNLIYGKNRKEMLDEPLTFNIISGGNIYWIASNVSFRKTIYYSKNGGSWTYIRSNTGSSAPYVPVSAGDIIQFKGDNPYYATSSYDTYFSASTSTKFSVEGNIMSLINSTGFSTATTMQSSSSYTFRNLFKNCDKLIGALDLVLPATVLEVSCYQNMFGRCTSLTTAPSILPATTLTNGCYYGMFSGCTSLTTAPELPATTLANYCYACMFQGCTSLTATPELPATTLTSSCYDTMFQGCAKLNYIKCLALNKSASYCTSNWVSGVASSGTFIKNPGMTSWTTGSSGIPNNWTVQDAS